MIKRPSEVFTDASKLFFPENNPDLNYPISTSEPVESPLIISEKSLDDDFNTSRETIRSVIDSAEKTFESLLEVIKETDSPRAFEVANQFLGTITNASKDLLDIHEKYQKLKIKKDSESERVQNNTQNNINNVIFSGNGKELLKLIKETT